MKDWRGIVALTLAAGVMIVLTAEVIASIVKTGDLTNDELALLSTVLGAAIGAIATYLGVTGAAGTLTHTNHYDTRRNDMNETERGPLPGDDIDVGADAQPTGTPVEGTDEAPEAEEPSEEQAEEATEGMGPGDDVS